MDNCKECVFIKELNHRVTKLETNIKELNEKITEVEKTTAVTEERIYSIFSTLKEIKKNIEKIVDRIEQKDQRPAQLLWSALGGIIVAIILAGLKYLNLN